MKTSRCSKKFKNYVKNMNRQIERDVFRGRFKIQIEKETGLEDERSVKYYLIQFIDKEEPSRNKYYGWVLGIDYPGCLFMDFNNFIVNSDFWKKYKDGYYDVDGKRAKDLNVSRFDTEKEKKEKLKMRHQLNIK